VNTSQLLLYIFLHQSILYRKTIIFFIELFKMTPYKNEDYYIIHFTFCPS